MKKFISNLLLASLTFFLFFAGTSGETQNVELRLKNPGRDEIPTTPPPTASYSDDTGELSVDASGSGTIIVSVTDSNGNEECQYVVTTPSATLPLPALDAGSYTLQVETPAATYQGQLQVVQQEITSYNNEGQTHIQG